MDRRTFVKYAALSSAVLAGCSDPSAQCQYSGLKGSRPNIIVVMADDMGYSDIGCFGSEIKTPHLDRLAAEGLRFTQFYNTARCCPSRASLMTGLYPHQAGVGYMDVDLGSPSYQGHLKAGCVTIAELLSQAGYRTIMSGKWHLGTTEGSLPWQRGFQRFYGIPEAGGVYFWPSTLKRTIVRYDADTSIPVTVEPLQDWYSTDAFTDYAVEQIRHAHHDGVPFFLYLPYVAPHFPHQAHEPDVRKYEGTYMQGWDAVRARRYSRQLELGIVDKTYELTLMDPNVPDWDSLNRMQHEQLDRQMAVYAGIIDNLDQNIGKLIDALQQIKQQDNTLILFLSDNGNQQFPRLGSNATDAPFGMPESFGKIALGWACVSNTPFRRYKQQVHFGGTASPLIVNWPRATVDKGSVRRQVSHIIDIVPTCLDAAGIEPMAGQLPGVSLLPSLERCRPLQSRTLFWEHAGNRAVLEGDWKLVAVRNGDWELYNVKDDLTELHDLSEQMPDRVTIMAGQYESWAKQSGVLPWPVSTQQEVEG